MVHSRAKNVDNLLRNFQDTQKLGMTWAAPHNYNQYPPYAAPTQGMTYNDSPHMSYPGNPVYFNDLYSSPCYDPYENISSCYETSPYTSVNHFQSQCIPENLELDNSCQTNDSIIEHMLHCAITETNQRFELQDKCNAKLLSSTKDLENQLNNLVNQMNHISELAASLPLDDLIQNNSFEESAIEVPFEQHLCPESDNGIDLPSYHTIDDSPPSQNNSSNLITFQEYESLVFRPVEHNGPSENVISCPSVNSQPSHPKVKKDTFNVYQTAPFEDEEDIELGSFFTMIDSELNQETVDCHTQEDITSNDIESPLSENPCESETFSKMETSETFLESKNQSALVEENTHNFLETMEEWDCLEDPDFVVTHVPTEKYDEGGIEENFEKDVILDTMESSAPIDPAPLALCVEVKNTSLEIPTYSNNIFDLGTINETIKHELSWKPVDFSVLVLGGKNELRYINSNTAFNDVMDIDRPLKESDKGNFSPVYVQKGNLLDLPADNLCPKFNYSVSLSSASRINSSSTNGFHTSTEKEADTWFTFLFDPGGVSTFG